MIALLVLCALTDSILSHDSHLTDRQPSTLINSHNFHYLINNPWLCHQDEQSIGLLVWVHSTPKHARRRQAIRETWANQKHFSPPTGSMRVVFFIGAVNDDTLQNKLYYENEVYSDLVQESYEDSYRNLTYKGMSALKWITRYCRNTNLLLKIDDDMVVDMQALFLRLAKTIKYPEQAFVSTIVCALIPDGRPLRHKDSKWMVTEEEYPRNEYPPYCSGLASLLSPDLIPKLWEISEKTKYFWLEDVFLTGLLTEQLESAPTWIQFDYYYHYGGTDVESCFRQHLDNPYYVFAHLSPYSFKLAYYLLDIHNKTENLPVDY